MLILPQQNNSWVRSPNKPDVVRLLEAYGFFPKQYEGPTVLMQRQYPDNNGYDGAWQARAAAPPEFEAIVQQQIQILN
jgi:hypothetical protein